MSLEGYSSYLAPVIVNGNVYYRLFVGLSLTQPEANDLMSELVDKGLKDEANAWHVRDTHLSFRMSAHDSAAEAEQEVEELFFHRIPTYVLQDGASYVVFAGGYGNVAEGAALTRALDALQRPLHLEDRNLETSTTLPFANVPAEITNETPADLDSASGKPSSQSQEELQQPTLDPSQSSDVQSLEATELIVQVRDLAGSTIYLSAGLDTRIQVGDTFSVSRTTQSGETLATKTDTTIITAVSIARKSSVWELASRPIPLTRGMWLRLEPHGQTTTRSIIAAADSTVDRRSETQIPSGGVPERGQRAKVPRLDGRMLLDMSTTRSTTEWGGDGIETGILVRTFATPSVRFNGTVSDLPGDLRLNLGLRSAYRYSTQNLIEAPTFRFYNVSVEKSGPWGEVRLGRFFNPYESYSGYWDGLMMRFTARGIGFGGAFGFQPNRFNEGFSTDSRKASAFMDYRLARSAFSWAGDVSVHRSDSDIGLPSHTFLGWSQDVRSGRIRVSQDLQLDQDPKDGTWVVSRLQMGGTFSVSDHLYLNAHFSRQRPYSIYRPVDVFSSLTSRTRAGLTYSSGWGTASADVGQGTIDGMGNSRNLSGSIFLRNPFGLRSNLNSSASYWVRGESSVFTLSPSISHLFGRIRGRFGYRFHQSKSPWSSLLTQGGTVTLNIPLRQGWQWTVQGMGTFGSNIRRYRAYTGLSLSFR